MTQNQLHSSNTCINSKYYINQIDSIIVQLTLALAIEHAIKPDPDAKNISRTIIQDHINVLLSDETKANLKQFINETIKKVKTGDQYAMKVYDMIKMMRLNNEY